MRASAAGRIPGWPAIALEELRVRVTQSWDRYPYSPYLLAAYPLLYLYFFYAYGTYGWYGVIGTVAWATPVTIWGELTTAKKDPTSLWMRPIQRERFTLLKCGLGWISVGLTILGVTALQGWIFPATVDALPAWRWVLGIGLGTLYYLAMSIVMVGGSYRFFAMSMMLLLPVVVLLFAPERKDTFPPIIREALYGEYGLRTVVTGRIGHPLDVLNGNDGGRRMLVGEIVEINDSSALLRTPAGKEIIVKVRSPAPTEAMVREKLWVWRPTFSEIWKLGSWATAIAPWIVIATLGLIFAASRRTET